MPGFARAVDLMAESGVAAMVASWAENITWATHYANWPIYTYKDQEVYGVLARNGAAALVVPHRCC
jgi:hypothetical protein